MDSSAGANASSCAAGVGSVSAAIGSSGAAIGAHALTSSENIKIHAVAAGRRIAVGRIPFIGNLLS